MVLLSVKLTLCKLFFCETKTFFEIIENYKSFSPYLIGNQHNILKCCVYTYQY
jgi:hypothetical protein